MPLTTDGLIAQIKNFRSDKLALVALIGSMGQESEADALERVREIKTLMGDRLTEMRRKGRGKVTCEEAKMKPIIQGVYDLCCEVEPWLAQFVEPKKAAA